MNITVNFNLGAGNNVPSTPPEPIIIDGVTSNADQTLDAIANPTGDMGCVVVEVGVPTKTDAGVAVGAGLNALIGTKQKGASATSWREVQPGQSLTIITDKISRIHFKSQTAGNAVPVQAEVVRSPFTV